MRRLGRRIEPRFGDVTLWNLVERRARETPEALMAVDEHGRRLSFVEYRDQALLVAAGLQELGVGSGVVVSWQLPTWLEALVLTAALARLDAVQNPMVPIYRDREIELILRQTGARMLIVPRRWRGHEYEAMARRVVARLDRPVEILVADRGLPEGDPALLGSVEPPGAASELPARWIYYTSGSTGDPKGVMHTDATLGTVATVVVGHLRMTAADRNAMVFPFSHIGGSNFLMAGLLSGCTNICVESFDPVATAEVLAREGVTLAGAGTAFHAAYLAAQRARPDTRLFPHIRAFPGGGAPKPPALHHEVKAELGGAGIVSALGMTECQVIAMNDIADPDDKLAATEGRPPEGNVVRIVAPDGRRCQAGEEGEIRVAAPQLFVGYVDDSLDAAAFDEDGLLRTGDLGFLDEDGYLTVTGRLKDVIIRKGENISAKEIEDALYRHPAVRDVAVIGLPDADTGERCCAVVVAAEGHGPLSMEEMTAHLRAGGLMMQKIPEQLVIVADLPRAPAGKVLKEELKKTIGDTDGTRRRPG